MGIETRTGGHDHVGRDGLEDPRRDGSCSHMSKKAAWMSVPSLTGSIFFSVLPSGVLCSTATGERARMGLGVAREERHGQVLGLRLRRVGVGLDPLGDFRRVRLLPVGHVRGIQLVGLDPVLGDGRMQGRPLGHDPRLSVELVLLEPAFDVGTDRLALLWAARVLHDGAKLPCHAVAEQVIAGAPVGSARGGRVVGRGRRTGLEILVGRERLGDEPRADRVAVAHRVTRLPWALSWNTVWPMPNKHQRIQHRAQEHGEDQQPKVCTQMSGHVLTPTSSGELDQVDGHQDQVDQFDSDKRRRSHRPVPRSAGCGGAGRRPRPDDT